MPRSFFRANKIAIVVIMFLFLPATALQAKKEQTPIDKSQIKSAPVQDKQGKSLKKTIPAPNLLGKTRSQADMILKKSGLRPGKINYVTRGAGREASVVKQSPSPGSKIDQGEEVDLWIMRSKSSLKKGATVTPGPQKNAGRIRPKLKAKGNKLFLQFPKDVQEVKIEDKNGKTIQSFKKGRSFDISKSLHETKAGRIRVVVTPEEQKGGGVYKGGPGEERYFNYNLISWEHLLERFADNIYGPADESAIDAQDRANNDISGATVLSGPGRYAAEVGGESDPIDYLQFSAGSGDFGYLVTIRRLSGDVNLHIYDENQVNLTNDQDKLWIAMKPGTHFFISVESNTWDSTNYDLAINRVVIPDPHEPNNSLAEATEIEEGRISGGTLGGVYDGHGHSLGTADYYKIYLHDPEHIRIRIRNAGLPSGENAKISLYPPNSNTQKKSNTGDADSGTLSIDLRPDYWPLYPDPQEPDENMKFEDTDRGYWKIEVDIADDYFKAYGTGNAPACFVSSRGYTLDVEFLD